jgi:TP901 family phage tail tape measure protein
VAGSLGTIKGQMILDVKQALAAYTAARAAHVSTVTALQTGGGALILAGGAIAAVGVGIAYGLGKAVDAAAEFERKLDFFGAVSNSTAAEMEQVRVKALQLGQDTIFSAGQIADSFVELGKSGVSAHDIINGIGQAVANLGAAADIPLDTAANIITSAVATFQLGADAAVGVADKLAGAANASIIDVQDLGVSLKYAGGVAQALGISFEDTNTALALLGQYGIKGSTAGTSLRQVLISLTGSTVKAKKELRALGIITEDGSNRFFDAEGHAKSLGEVFQVLQDATRGMSDEQRLAALKLIFATRALPSVISLSREGAAGFASMSAEINKTTALEVASKRLDNLSGDLEILRGNIETLTIKAGGQLQAFARGVVQGVTSIVQWFANLSDSTQLTILKVAAIAAAILIFVGALGIFAGAVLQLIGLATRIYDAFLLLRAGMLALTSGTWALNAAFLANPITWIILAVVALVAAFVLLWRNNEGFRDFFITMWAAIRIAAENVFNWFKALPAWFSATWTSIKDGAVSIWNGILDFFRQWGPWMIAALFGPIGILVKLIMDNWDAIKQFTIDTWNSILAFFAALPGQIGEFLSALPGIVGYWIGFAIGFILRLWIDGWLLIFNGLVAAVNAIISFVSQIPGWLGAIWQAVMDAAVAAWNAIVSFFTETIPALVNNVIAWFGALPNRLGAIWSSVWTTTLNIINSIQTAVVNWAINTVNSAISWFSQLPARIGEFFSNIWSTISSTTSNIFNNVSSFAQSVYNTVSDWIGKLPSLIGGIFNNVVQAFKDVVKRAFNAAKDFASGIWEGFKDGLGIHSPSHIERAMWQITGVVDEETQRMVKQVKQIQGLGNDLTEVGATMGEGLSLGMDKSLAVLANGIDGARAQQAEFAALAASSTAAFSATVTGQGTGNQVVVVEKGDTNNVDITWNAAPNDQVNTREQVKNLLGKTAGILTEES